MNTNQERKDAEMLTLKAQPVLNIRKTIPIDHLMQEMGDRIPALWSYVEECGAEPGGPVYVRYHTFEDNETDLEVGIPVVEPVAGKGRIMAGELPGGPAITTWHFGPHDKLGEAYARIEAYQKEHGREPASPSWEVYHWITSGQVDSSQVDPSAWGTQLVQPVK